METFILKSMTDFVLEQNEKINKNFKKNILMTQGETLDELNNFVDVVTNYANFLKKPLKLGYFIACSEMDNPIIFYGGIPSKKKLELFEEAKQRVLFEGFEYDKENDWVTYNEFARFFVSELQNGKVEDLFKLIKDEITLTETSIKEIGYDKN